MKKSVQFSRSKGKNIMKSVYFISLNPNSKMQERYVTIGKKNRAIIYSF